MEVASFKGMRPAASPPGLRASRRNALRRHYEHDCAAPNEANFQRMELAGGVCRIGAYIRDGRLVHLNKRSQFACNRWLRKGLERTRWAGRPGEQRQFRRGFKLEVASVKGTEGEAKSSGSSHFKLPTWLFLLARDCPPALAPNEANSQQMDLPAGACRRAGHVRHGGQTHLNKQSQLACNCWLRKRLWITERMRRREPPHLTLPGFWWDFAEGACNMAAAVRN